MGCGCICHTYFFILFSSSLLRTLDPVKARGLFDLLEYEPADEVEDIFCLDFTANYRYLGMDHTVGIFKEKWFF